MGPTPPLDLQSPNQISVAGRYKPDPPNPRRLCGIRARVHGAEDPDGVLGLGLAGLG